MARTRTSRPASVPFVLGLLTLPALHRVLAPGADSDREAQQRRAQGTDGDGREGAPRAPGARRGAFAVAKEAVIVISTAVLTAAFWLLIRFLPDVAPPLRAAWTGALVSALLFAIGKHLIGLYLARGAVASAYGAAGSFIVVVLWVYYSAQILLLGAEVARAIDSPQRSAERAGAGDAALAGEGTA